MIGTIINAVLVLIGGGLGLLLRKGIPDRVKDTVMQGLSLVVIVIGLSGALKTQDMLGMIICIVIGGLMGSLIDIEKRLDQLGAFAEKKLGGEDGSVSKGFVTASLVFCVGAMAIVGSLDSGLRGDHSTLIAKGVIDAVTAMFFASALGAGVLLSAAAIFVYQGAIALLAGLLSPALTDVVITEMSAVGGLLIAGVGINLMSTLHIKVGNLLPAIFLPMAYVPIAALLG